ncbi:MAG: deoxyribose-phosphate aldolase [Spirochaetaceae bacterium]|jgi:deoxyribose-phosphate aldolase|nr:deoxyribose-phosphate aldolase [Spirochaetaceae bacterium]
MTKEELAAKIDHTLLKPAATEQDIEKLCSEAREYRFWSVCVNSSWVRRVKQLAAGSSVKVCAVAGFPLGVMSTAAKAEEARIAVEDGADEIDMVINIGFLKSGKTDAVQEDIEAVKRACTGRLLKVIIETCLLTDEEKVLACELARKAGADFVKTSTGFSTAGAVEADVKLMRKSVPGGMGVKASGGVKTYDDAVKMLAAGASRIGTSNGIAILEAWAE